MQEGNEIIRCLDAGTGNELWQDKYATQGATGAAASHDGPRASPTVADGKVVTLGVRGMMSCLDAETGKVLWRKDDFKSWPQFFTSSSPIVVDGLCIAQLGGGGAGRGGRGGPPGFGGGGAARGEGAQRGEGAASSRGGIVAYDLTSGEEKWKWTEDLPAYASPVLMTIDGQKLVVALTAGKLVALGASDGKLAWETAVGGGGGGGRGGRGGPPGGGFGGFGGGQRGERGGQRGEGGAQPGGGREAGEQAEAAARAAAAKAEEVKQEAVKQEAAKVAQGAAEQRERGAQPGGERRGGPGGGRGGRGGGMGGGRNYNASTPVVNGQTIYYCGAGIKAVKLEKDGDKVVAKELWSNSDEGMNISFNSPVLKDGLLFGLTSNHQYFCVNAETGKTAWTSPRGQKAASGRGSGYGSLVDAGSVLLAITSGAELVAIKPTDAEYNEIARIEVSDSPTYAHLVVAGNRLFVKNQDAVRLLTID
jgi:outer membrane protein assembly factor BamB